MMKSSEPNCSNLPPSANKERRSKNIHHVSLSMFQLPHLSSALFYSFSSLPLIDLTVRPRCPSPRSDLSAFPCFPGSCSCRGLSADLTPSRSFLFWPICRSSVPLLCPSSATWLTPWPLTCGPGLPSTVVVISRWFSAMWMLCPLGMPWALVVQIASCRDLIVPCWGKFSVFFFSFLFTFVFLSWLSRNDHRILVSRDQERRNPLFGFLMISSFLEGKREAYFMLWILVARTSECWGCN